ncbi:hypothetical protein QM467_00645 [Rhodoblastus sp. 17X3]|uniref:hypothetical protein n=1 Tax=Rhodoblastus sp. 17X3 TaxID=3047026 RepID=UPI0024B7C424|nr:hypothetical protein [Rhodoblastus sp. 17X3]MDI9846559.1 hypothetical protein [Rhodoblastus sp. 17X3]
MIKTLKLVEPIDGENVSPGREMVNKLLGERQEHLSEATGLRQAIERLSGAEQAEHAYSADLAGIEAREAADVQAWATSGKGDAPGPRIEERKDLENRSAETRATAAAARTAAGQLRQQLNEAERKAKAIEAEIELAVLDILAEEITPIVDELKEVAAHHNKLIAKALGVREPLILLGHQRNSRLPNSGLEHLRWLEQYDAKIGDLKPVGPSTDDVRRAQLEWSAHIAETTGGVVKGLDQ